MDFSHRATNHNSNTPLSKAVAHARLELVEWLVARQRGEFGELHDEGAAELARHLADESGSPPRQRIAELLCTQAAVGESLGVTRRSREAVMTEGAS